MTEDNLDEAPQPRKTILGIPIAVAVLLALPGLAIFGFVAAVAINQYAYVASLHGQNIFEYFFSSMDPVKIIKSILEKS